MPRMLALAVLVMMTWPAAHAQTVSPPSRVLPHAGVIQPVQATPIRQDRVRIWGALFRAQVERCWRKPALAATRWRQAVFKLELTRDGRVASLTAVSAGETADSQAYQASCSEAILRCQPYRLPEDDYDAWRSFEPVFREKLR